MRRDYDTHVHTCSRPGCAGKVICTAPWERNYDGIPPIICAAQAGMFGFDGICDECHEASLKEAADDAASDLL